MLSDNIKILRKKKGYSQETLAEQLHVVRQTISKWEKGISVPDAVMLDRMAELFEVPVSVLLGGGLALLILVLALLFLLEALCWLALLRRLRAYQRVKSAARFVGLKDEYLERKKSNAERRRQEKHMKEVEREIGKLEHELVDIDDFLGSDEAGVDYVRAAELYDRKIVIEDRLMQLYEEEEAYAAEKEAENAENA